MSNDERDLERLWEEFLATAPMNMDLVMLVTEKDQNFWVQDRAWAELCRRRPTVPELCTVIAGAPRFRDAAWRELKTLGYREASFMYAIDFLKGDDRNEACEAILANNPSEEALLCLLSRGSGECVPRAWAELVQREPPAGFLIDSLHHCGEYRARAGLLALHFAPTVEQLLVLMVEVPELRSVVVSSLLRLNLLPRMLVRIFKHAPEYRGEAWRRIKEHDRVTSADIREVFSTAVACTLPMYLEAGRLILDRADDDRGIVLVAVHAPVLRDEAWNLLSRRYLDLSLLAELMGVPELETRVDAYSKARTAVGMAAVRLADGVPR